jgi:NifU-like protein
LDKNAFSLFSPWTKFSRKLADKMETLRFAGLFSEEEAKMRGMRLAVGGSFHEGERSWIRFYFLVDEWDGVIADVKFQAFGPISLLGAADVCAEIVIRKNYDQAQKIGADLIDRHVRDKKDREAFSPSDYPYLNLVIDALTEAAKLCADIPLPESYTPTPMQPSLEGGPYPGWQTLSLEQQIAVIEDVISADIRPYIELDAGGIEIVSLTEGKDLVIAYKGACTTCHSATGSTLNAIQQILSAKVHPDIRVIPDSSFLQ